MPRERKPLIEPGSLLPSVAEDNRPSDTLSRILERDRASTGRRAPSAAATAEPEEKGSSPRTTPEDPTQAKSNEGNITSNITAHINSHTRSNEDAQPYAHKRSNARSKSGGNKRSKPDAQEYARKLAATKPFPITLRLPEGLNDWLDDYAHEHRKEGIKKQDLVSHAVQLLVVELTASNQDTEEEI